MRWIHGVACAVFIGFGATSTLAQPVRTHTLWQWEQGTEFLPLAATLERPFEGEIVETRLTITLHDVPAAHDPPLDAADIYVLVNIVGADPVFPEFPVPLFLRVEGGLNLEFSGVGGPMTGIIVSDALNGPVWVSDNPDEPGWWGFEMGDIRTDIPFAGYGPVTGTIEIDYIPAAGAPCPCERTGDAPANVDVFDLLAYLDLWFAADADANLNSDEIIDVFDLLAYLDCWFAPAVACP